MKVWVRGKKCRWVIESHLIDSTYQDDASKNVVESATVYSSKTISKDRCEKCIVKTSFSSSVAHIAWSFEIQIEISIKLGNGGTKK